MAGFVRQAGRAIATRRSAARFCWTLAVLFTVGILYSAFELGRYDAGYRVVDSVRGALVGEPAHSLARSGE